jgi:hypothetical protein
MIRTRKQFFINKNISYLVEYETQSQNLSESENIEYSNDPMNKSGFQINGWNKYLPPPNINISDTKDFIYFSDDCKTDCILKPEKFDFENKNIINATLTFKVSSVI